MTRRARAFGRGRRSKVRACLSVRTGPGSACTRGPDRSVSRRGRSMSNSRDVTDGMQPGVHAVSRSPDRASTAPSPFKPIPGATRSGPGRPAHLIASACCRASCEGRISQPPACPVKRVQYHWTGRPLIPSGQSAPLPSRDRAPLPSPCRKYSGGLGAGPQLAGTCWLSAAELKAPANRYRDDRTRRANLSG